MLRAQISILDGHILIEFVLQAPSTSATFQRLPSSVSLHAMFVHGGTCTNCKRSTYEQEFLGIIRMELGVVGGCSLYIEN